MQEEERECTYDCFPSHNTVYEQTPIETSENL